METAIYWGYVVHIITTSPLKALNSNEAGGGQKQAALARFSIMKVGRGLFN